VHSILMLNAKGGCGKTTVATNLASYFAALGNSVVLADFDPQGSSVAWLAARPRERPSITGVAAWRDPVRGSERPDYLIIDAPGRPAGSELKYLIRHANHVIIPILPSPIDIRAGAHFIHDLLLTCKALRHEGKLGIVANRVRESTLSYQRLQRFLNSLQIPFITSLRETQNYIRAAETGLGIFEMPTNLAATDQVQWQPLLAWLQLKDDTAPQDEALLHYEL